MVNLSEAFNELVPIIALKQEYIIFSGWLVIVNSWQNRNLHLEEWISNVFKCLLEIAAQAVSSAGEREQQDKTIAKGT